MRRAIQTIVGATLLCAGLAACGRGPTMDTETPANSMQGTPPAAPGGTGGTGPGAVRTAPSDSPIGTGTGGGSSGGASGGKAGGGGTSGGN